MEPNKPLYTIERWPHGWLFCGKGHGIPINALSETKGLFGRGTVLSAAIPHHFNASGHRSVVFCVGTAKELKAWEAEIEKSLANLDAQARWWRGLDVGTSSAAVFAVFCRDDLKGSALEVGRGAVPRDAGDLGRCLRLLRLFPEWRADLPRVADAYPDTKWRDLVARWSELETATTEQQGAILDSILR